MMYPNEVIVHDYNYGEFATDDLEVNGQPVRRGLIPRDYTRFPQGCYKSAPAWSLDMPLIPRSEWPDRCADQIKAGSRLSDIRCTGNKGGLIPSLDQNGRGYCWAHSSTSCVMLLRAVAHESYVGLSAYAIACIIKNYRDEGGWGAQSLDFIVQKGVPSEAFWPMQSVNRSNDNPNTWANAALHKVTEGFVDLAAAQYSRNLTFDQMATCFLLGIPVICDFNWWGHSVCGLDLVNGSTQWGVTRTDSGKLASLLEFERMWGMNDPVTAGFGSRILNSWGDSWSDRGMGTLTGSKAVMDGGCAPRVTSPADV